MAKLKSFLSLVAGYMLAILVAIMWLMSGRRKPKMPEVEVKEVPEDLSDVEKELRDRHLIK